MRKTINNNFFILSYYWKYCRGFFLLKLLTVLLAPVHPIIFIMIMKYAIDAVVAKRPIEEILIALAGAFIIVLISSALINFINHGNGLVANKIVAGKIQEEFFSKAETLDYACFDDPEFYNNYTRAMAETDNRAKEVLNNFISFLCDLVTLLMVLATILFTLSPFVILICALLIVANFMANSGKNKNDFKIHTSLTPPARMMSYAKKIFYEPQYAQEIKLGKLGPLMKKKFGNAVENDIRISKKFMTSNAFYNMSFNVIGYILTFSIMAVSCWKITKGTQAIGDFAASLNAAEQLFKGFYGLLGSTAQMNMHSRFIDNLRYILNYKPEIMDNEDGLEIPKSASQNIRFNNVSFSYPNKKKPVLKNINLDIHPGSKVAIVGYNGAGKTTLVKLLLRLYDPTEGTIYLGGNSYPQYRLKDIREHFSVVFQDYKCYAVNVAENVTMMDSSVINKERFANALKKSGIAEKIETLDNKANTMLSREFDENGIILSGGEQQKIAIARAFYDSHEVLIFDEPSSALDPLAEYELSQRIRELSDSKTVIMISHRLSTITLFDEIYMINDGMIIEKGSHNELMERKGKYYEMFIKQASNYAIVKETKA